MKLIPALQELAARPDVEYIAGGAGQNSVRVAQWMLQVPHATAYMGCVGSDDFAARMTEQAKKDGVNVSGATGHRNVLNTDALLEPFGTCASMCKQACKNALLGAQVYPACMVAQRSSMLMGLAGGPGTALLPGRS